MNINALFTALAVSSPQGSTHEVESPEAPDVGAAAFSRSSLIPSAPPAVLSTGSDARLEAAQLASQSTVKPVQLASTPLVTTLARQAQRTGSREELVASSLGVPAQTLKDAFKKAQDEVRDGGNLLEKVAEEIGVDVKTLHQAMRTSGMKLIDRRA